MSQGVATIENMFEDMTGCVAGSDESAMVAAIAALERVKSAAAAGQARLTAALDRARRGWRGPGSDP